MESPSQTNLARVDIAFQEFPQELDGSVADNERTQMAALRKRGVYGVSNDRDLKSGAQRVRELGVRDENRANPVAELFVDGALGCFEFGYAHEYGRLCQSTDLSFGFFNAMYI